MDMICPYIELIKLLILPIAVLFCYAFDRYYIKRKVVFPAAIVIVAFIIASFVIPQTYIILKDYYRCHEYLDYREPTNTLTVKYYTYEEYKSIESQCNHFKRYHIYSIDNNDTIIKTTTQTPQKGIEILAFECFPEKNTTNIIQVWGDCKYVAKTHAVYPNSWYSCNNIPPKTI